MGQGRTLAALEVGNAVRGIVRSGTIEALVDDLRAQVGLQRDGRVDRLGPQDGVEQAVEETTIACHAPSHEATVAARSDGFTRVAGVRRNQPGDMRAMTAEHGRGEPVSVAVAVPTSRHDNCLCFVDIGFDAIAGLFATL